MKLRNLGFLACFFAQASFAGLTDELGPLRSNYSDEIEMAANRGAYANSAFRLGFSVDPAPQRERIGNVLRAISIQDNELDNLIANASELPQTIVRPGNDLKTDAVLKLVELNIARDCRLCTSIRERLYFAQAAHDLFEIYDIQAAGVKSKRTGATFSGLPFFNSVSKAFLNSTFQMRASAFHEELRTIALQLQSNPKYMVQTNVNDIALKVCDGDREAATELAGLLISRDSNVIKYFNFLPKTDLRFTTRVSQTPLLVQLIAEIDKERRASGEDRFSYDGIHASTDVRNYYFWSSAYVSQELRKRGASGPVVRELNLQFARHYKIVRWYEEQFERVVGFIKRKPLPPIDQNFHQSHAFKTMRLTGAGSRMITRETCESIFENGDR